MRRVKWIGSAAWVWSWYTMYLEIFRWKHVTPSLRFDSTPIPGIGVRPTPGLPLKALYACFFGAPVLVVAAAMVDAVSTGPTGCVDDAAGRRRRQWPYDRLHRRQR